MSPDPNDPEHRRHAGRLASSYRYWTGQPLLPDRGETRAPLSHRLYHAPFAVLSHGGGADPIFDYANRQAQLCFEMGWAELTRLPSRLSAEPDRREERERLLAAVREHGFVTDYGGVRIARSGRRFHIRGAVVWTLVDDQANAVGQAALFSDWQPLGS